MSGHILNSSYEYSPLQEQLEQHQAKSLGKPNEKFWDQYFELQQVVEEVALADGAISLQVTNSQTGETVTVDNVKVRLDSDSH